VLKCPFFRESREDLKRGIAPFQLETPRDFREATDKPAIARKLIHWALNTGRFPQFAQAVRLGGPSERPRKEQEDQGYAGRRRVIIHDEEGAITGLYFLPAVFNSGR